jgi:integrase
MTRRIGETKQLRLKHVVDAIRARDERYMVWDTELRGFGLDVWPSGRRSWIVFYRASGRGRRMTLGTTDVVTPTQARTLALDVLSRVAQGDDPLDIRRVAAREARRVVERGFAGDATVEHVAQRYLATLRARRSPRWATEAERLYDTKIKPELGARAVREIKIKDVRALHEMMVATPVMANRVKAVISAIVTRAIEDGERPRELLNPAGAIVDYPEIERERYLMEDEWPRVAKAVATLRVELEHAPSWDTRRQQLDALITLALTGARLRAVLPRRWKDVDWAEHALVVNPPHKGVSRILLGEQAIAHLRYCFDRTGGGSGFIFPGQARRLGARVARGARDIRPIRQPSPVASLAPMWAQLTALAELDNFTLHDWRRTFATVAGDVGISDHMIGGLLGHRVPGVRRRYARRTDEALLDAANKVSAEVSKRLALAFPNATSVLPFGVKYDQRTV